jgi:flagellar capping protein FliD
MESIRTEAKKLNDEQEKLKADLKSKTDALNTKMEELTKKYSEAKKVVKLEFPQTQWMEFGISDKR